MKENLADEQNIQYSRDIYKMWVDNHIHLTEYMTKSNTFNIFCDSETDLK